MISSAEVSLIVTKIVGIIEDYEVMDEFSSNAVAIIVAIEIDTSPVDKYNYSYSNTFPFTSASKDLGLDILSIFGES